MSRSVTNAKGMLPYPAYRLNALIRLQVLSRLYN